jgi:hypothetical protein
MRAASRREHYESELECPSCALVCIATWLENENPIHGRSGLGRSLVTLSKGFRQAQDSNTVICVACNVSILRWT